MHAILARRGVSALHNAMTGAAGCNARIAVFDEDR